MSTLVHRGLLGGFLVLTAGLCMRVVAEQGVLSLGRHVRGMKQQPATRNKYQCLPPHDFHTQTLQHLDTHEVLRSSILSRFSCKMAIHRYLREDKEDNIRQPEQKLVTMENPPKPPGRAFLNALVMQHRQRSAEDGQCLDLLVMYVEVDIIYSAHPHVGTTAYPLEATSFNPAEEFYRECDQIALAAGHQRPHRKRGRRYWGPGERHG